MGGDAVAAARADVLAAARALAGAGLVAGTSGNLSARVDGERVCLTPSSVPYDAMGVDDLVVVDLDGRVLEGTRGPTSEKALHLACYRAHPEIGGVIHSHPVHATMFAVARQPVPAAIEEVAVYVGGEVPVCEYAMTGSDALGDIVAAALADRAAALLANHGLVAVGATVERALHTTQVVERTAHIVWGARLLGPVHAVPARVNDDFAAFYRLTRAPRP